MNIYQYENYRDLLKDLFERKKERDGECTQREFAAQAGFSNPGYFNDVLKERRGLSKDAIEKIIKVFDLSSSESDYFRLLVNFNQAKKLEQKDEFYKKMLFRRSRSNFAKVNPDLARYYQDYRYPLVRSAIEVVEFRGEYQKLADYIRPTITYSIVKKIVRDLCEWKLVEQNSTGRYIVTSKFLEPSPTMKEQVRSLNRVWLNQAEEALVNIPANQRHISTVLLNIDEEKHKKVLEKINTLRKEIFKLVEEVKKPTRTMQMSMVYFPKCNIDTLDEVDDV